jgi:hypothetical protein
MLPEKIERFRGAQPDFIYEFITQDADAYKTDAYLRLKEGSENIITSNKALLSNLLNTNYFDSMENIVNFM